MRSITLPDASLRQCSAETSSLWGRALSLFKKPGDGLLRSVSTVASGAMAANLAAVSWRVPSLTSVDVLSNLAITVMLLYVFVRVPSATRQRSNLATRLLLEPHVLIVLILAVRQLLHSRRSPPHAVVAAPFLLCCDIVISQLFMAASSLAMPPKLSILAISSVVHLTRPVLFKASEEFFAILLAGLIGALYGAIFTSALRDLGKTAESAESRRRADSKLFHAVKGQCGSAAALLREVARSRDTVAESADNLQTDSIELELLPDVTQMLTQVSEW